jgi:hypothetical protein
LFCPNEGGAFKQTTTGHWAHLLCAIWIPELGVGNAIYMEPVEGVEQIPKNRWKLVSDTTSGSPVVRPSVRPDQLDLLDMPRTNGRVYTVHEPELFHRFPRHVRSADGPVDEHEVPRDGRPTHRLLRETSTGESTRPLPRLTSRPIPVFPAKMTHLLISRCLSHTIVMPVKGLTTSLPPSPPRLRARTQSRIAPVRRSCR